MSVVMTMIISGGQTGIDQFALSIAHELGYQTGGYMPKGYLTEDGSMSETLRAMFGMKETNSSSYPVRTEANVKAADFTVILNRAMGPGSRLTIKLCKKHNKVCLVNPTVDQFKEISGDGTEPLLISPVLAVAD